MRIGIIDYGLGNLRSVAGAIEHVGATPIISSAAAELTSVDRLILPGVGAFGDGMAGLAERNLIPTLNELVLTRKIPVLGICLGAQLVAGESEEFGQHAGLGWIKASVKRIPDADSIRLPHVGWNDVRPCKASAIMAGLGESPIFYFVHSYRIVPADRDDLVATTQHGCEIAAILEHDNIYATQFHPEKSQADGLRLLRNFVEVVGTC